MKGFSMFLCSLLLMSSANAMSNDIVIYNISDSKSVKEIVNRFGEGSVESIHLPGHILVESLEETYGIKIGSIHTNDNRFVRLFKTDTNVIEVIPNNKGTQVRIFKNNDKRSIAI